MVESPYSRHGLREIRFRGSNHLPTKALGGEGFAFRNRPWLLVLTEVITCVEAWRFCSLLGDEPLSPLHERHLLVLPLFAALLSKALVMAVGLEYGSRTA